MGEARASPVVPEARGWRAPGACAPRQAVCSVAGRRRRGALPNLHFGLQASSGRFLEPVQKGSSSDCFTEKRWNPWIQTQWKSVHTFSKNWTPDLSRPPWHLVTLSHTYTLERTLPPSTNGSTHYYKTIHDYTEMVHGRARVPPRQTWRVAVN